MIDNNSCLSVIDAYKNISIKDAIVFLIYLGVKLN